MYPLFFHFAAVNVTERNARTLLGSSSSFDSSILWFSWNTLCAHIFRSVQSVDFIQGRIFMIILFLFFFFIYPYSCMFVLYIYICSDGIEFSEKENDCEKRKRRINTHAYNKWDVRCWLGEICVLVIFMPLHTYDNFLSHFLNLSSSYSFSLIHSLLFAINQPERNILPKHSLAQRWSAFSFNAFIGRVMSIEIEWKKN